MNACGQQTTFRYDQLGNVTDDAPMVPIATFGYDAAGRLVYARNPDAEIWLDRDPLGRMTAETCNGRTVTSEYDAAGARPAGSPRSARSPSGTTTRPGSRCC